MTEAVNARTHAYLHSPTYITSGRHPRSLFMETCTQKIWFSMLYLK